MEVSSVYRGNISPELASMKEELNNRLDAIGKDDGSFERVDTLGKRPIVCWTYRCNASCPECYAQKLKQDFSSQTMPAGEFGRILDLFQKALVKFEGVTLLGGEPTLPGTFSDLLHELEERGLLASIYTNGVRMRDNADGVFDRIVGSPSVDQVTMHFQMSHINDRLYLQRMEELGGCGKSVIARYNFNSMPGGEEIDMILDRVAALGLPLSWSFSHPIESINGASGCSYIRPEQFGPLSEVLHHFIEKAHELGVELRMGVPVPLCTFKKEDLAEYQRRWKLKYNCIGVGDVHPNGLMSQCTIVPQISTLKAIKTPAQLATTIRFFQEQHKKLRDRFTSFPRCNPGCRISNPERYRLCSGGCTAYRLYDGYRA